MVNGVFDPVESDYDIRFTRLPLGNSVTSTGFCNNALPISGFPLNYFGRP